MGYFELHVTNFNFIEYAQSIAFYYLTPWNGVNSEFWRSRFGRSTIFMRKKIFKKKKIEKKEEERKLPEYKM